MKNLLKVVSVILMAAVLASCSKVSGFSKDSFVSALEKNGVTELSKEEYAKGHPKELSYHKFDVAGEERQALWISKLEVEAGEFSDYYLVMSQNDNVDVEIVYANYIQETKAQADFDEVQRSIANSIVGTGKADDGKNYAMAFVNANAEGQKDPEKEAGKYWYQAIYKDGTGIITISISIQNTTYDFDKIEQICKDIGITSPTDLT